MFKKIKIRKTKIQKKRERERYWSSKNYEPAFRNEYPNTKNSSNSLRLVEVAQANGVKTAHLIDNEDTLNKFLDEFDSESMPNVGLTAGASAPETLVQVLISKLRKKFDVNLIDHEVTKENVTFNLPKILR